MINVGDRVRPKGKHIAENHIGTVVEIVASGNCPTCGQTVPIQIAVQWDSSGRVGLWHPSGLDLVNEVPVGG